MTHVPRPLRAVFLDVGDTVELRGDSNRPLESALFRLHHTPLFDGEAAERAERTQRIEAEMTLAERYLALTEFARAKIARVVDIFAHHLQTQEAMTAQIAGVIQDVLNPRGVAVMLEAEHMCMAMRGIRKQGSTTLTSTFTGSFRDSPEEQIRFVTMVRAGMGALSG